MRALASAVVGLVLVSCGIGARGLLEGAPDGPDGGGPGSDGSSSGGPVDGASGDANVDASVDAACGDTTNDPNHCGECGRSCLGATCSMSLCTPTQLAEQLSEPYGVVVVGGTAYIAEHTSGHIRQVPANGGANTLYFNTGQAPWSIAAGASGLYWGEQTKVRLLPFASPSSVDIALTTGDGCSVAVKGAKLYFGICAGGDLVRAADLDMTDAYDVSTSQNDPRGIAFDGTHVYWSNNSGGTIGRAPLAGGAPETVVSGESGADTIAVIGSYIYWTVPGSVRRAPIGPTVPWPATTYVSGEGRPRSIVADGTRLYWLDSSTSVLRRIDTAKGPPALTIARNETQQAAVSVNTAIAFDATYVYWVTNTPGGKLKRLPK